jgi:hypothetical protein
MFISFFEKGDGGRVASRPISDQSIHVSPSAFARKIAI